MSFLAILMRVLRTGTKNTAFGNRLARVEQTRFTGRVAEVFGSSPEKLIQDLVFDPAKISENLGQLTTDERKELADTMNEELVGTDTSILSSSWLSAGVYESTGFNTGNLTLTLKDGKSYTYFGVPIGIWVAMKEASGSNGSGAGSVFWLWLRGASTTVSYQKVQETFRLTGA